ncbi:hypothetical protein [Leifsonia shinshuensis]|uniref:Uncharacterized protein n=1 Tax=Leifsonia shinshuensis TaxID=150026 RepID=A0A7G6YBK5_9MICO|nr:hypothetical protein [Leifsonia shinshuensis]QNE35870.1 hypothetical protein F1C12_12530 [Leifsonia shinshuensis]
MSEVRGFDVWLAGGSPPRVAGRLILAGVYTAFFTLNLAGLGAFLLHFGDGPGPVVDRVRLACASLADSAALVLPLALTVILASFASVYAIGVSEHGATERRERDVAVRCGQIVAVLAVAYAVAVVVGIHHLSHDVGLAGVVVVVAAGCAMLAGLLTRFFVGDLDGRIIEMERLIKKGQNRSGRLVGVATQSRRHGWLTLLINIGVPGLACVVACFFVAGSWPERLTLAAEMLAVVAVSAVAAVIAMWPTAHDGWGRHVDLVQQVVTTCFAFVVPATVVSLFAPRVAPILFDSHIPPLMRVTETAPLTVSIAACVAISLSAVVPWHRTVFRILTPWTLWGLASAFGRWSVTRSVKALEYDLGAAKRLRGDGEAA